MGIDEIINQDERTNNNLWKIKKNCVYVKNTYCIKCQIPGNIKLKHGIDGTNKH